jgi:short-subunit dehydrogenase
MYSMKDKTIVLTGAAGGIGRAVAELLDTVGATLVLTDINGNQLEVLNHSLGDRHYTVEADLASAEGRSKLVDCCTDMLSPPQMLINIAGINQFAKLADYSDEQLTKLINVNLTSQIALCRDFLPLFSRLSAAAIINVGSILGSIGMPGYSVYCASKFGLRGFSEALGRELMDSPVEVRYFAPRATQTALNDSRVNEMNKALGNAMDTPQRVAAELVSFLKNHEKRGYLGWPEKLFVRINSLFPSLVDKSFRKQLGVIKRYL